MNGKSKPGRPRLADPRTHRYNFKLCEEENIRFCRMLAEAGLEHNRSRFIVKRIFAEEFRVVRIDPTLSKGKLANWNLTLCIYREYS